MRTKIAIIGAGFSGVCLAQLLKKHGQITLFEKARGVSGRLSTRRSEPYFFDHGAQYFTLRTKPFQTFMEPLIHQGVIQPWHARYVTFEGQKKKGTFGKPDQEIRYVGVPNMNMVAKYFAKNLSIHINTRIESLEQQEGAWRLIEDHGQTHGPFDWVVSTLPSPQAVDLLPPSFRYYHDIKGIQMRACFALMLGFKTPLPLDFDAAHVTQADINWIAVNSQKPGRPDAFTLLVHASEAFSDSHIDDDRKAVMQHLMDETSRVLGVDVHSADVKMVHGWRYANNAIAQESKHVFLDDTLQLAACGDWCCGGRVEGAFTSAHRLAQDMKARL